MLKNIGFSSRQKTELTNTPGEILRDNIIRASIKTAEEAAYKVSNETDSFLILANETIKVAKYGLALGSTTESCSAIGRIAFKTSKDISRGDTVCTGLCLVSGGCEILCLTCSTVKIIPFRGRIYMGSKCVIKGCIAFRNACAGEGC